MATCFARDEFIALSIEHTTLNLGGSGDEERCLLDNRYGSKKVSGCKNFFPSGVGV